MVRIFDEADYDEYEKVTGKRIRDLNRQRNYLIETVKKEWKQNRAWHYKQLDKNPFEKGHVIPSNMPIEPEEFEIPMLVQQRKKPDETFKKKLQKMRQKAIKAMHEQKQQNKQG